jgi:hypothetical protein
LGKKPLAKRQPESRKQVFGAPPAVEDKRPVWRLRDLDWGGPFSCTVLDAPTLERVVRKLGEFETMQWHDIDGKTGSHPIPVGQLHRDAQQRLEEIGQADIDELYSLRVMGRERVFGVRDRWILRILWWDPDHAVCPSMLKHT